MSTETPPTDGENPQATSSVTSATNPDSPASTDSEYKRVNKKMVVEALNAPAVWDYASFSDNRELADRVWPALGSEPTDPERRSVTVDRDSAESFGEFGQFRKTAISRISTFTMPPGTTYQTPEGLRAEDEETRIAFDTQGGVYPIRESVFRESYALAGALDFYPDGIPQDEIDRARQDLAEPTEPAGALDVERFLDSVRAYGDARADVAYGRATRKAIDHAWDQMLAATRIPPMDRRLAPSEPRADSEGLRAAIERIHRHRDGCNGRPHRRWYRGENKCESLARAALRREQPAAEGDVRPELVAYFHESEEICDHDLNPWPCEINADALMESFTVTPRLYEQRDGTVSFQRNHFHRLVLADELAAYPNNTIEEVPTWQGIRAKNASGIKLKGNRIEHARDEDLP